MIENIKASFDLISYIHKIWEKRSTIFFLIISLLLYVISQILSIINFEGNQLNEIFNNWIQIRNQLLFLMISESILIIVWYFSRKLPKIKKSETGVVFAIISENDKLKNTIKTDFINKIHKAISITTHKNIKLISLSEYHSNRILDNPKYLGKYHKRTNANLIICGRASIREKDKYLLDITNVSVSHKPIAQFVSYVFGKEINSIYSRENVISIENELTGFKICSSLFSYSAQYILGVAFFLSKKMDEALDFHKSLLSVIGSHNKSTPTEAKILKRIELSTLRLVVEEAFYFSRYFYFKDRKLEKMKFYLDIIEEYEPENYSFLLLSAIYHFLSKRDINKSLEIIEKAKNSNDFTWAYSKAFLVAYKGNLKEAYRIYMRAFKKTTSNFAYIQTEEFMQDILQDEPDKIQLYYCIGLINYFKKEDYILALNNFKIFVDESISNNINQEHIGYVRKYIHKIESKYGV